jgi:hypothetical protein
MKKLFLILLLAASSSAMAQVTDPMITNWWFNTTNNMYKGILTDVEAVYYTSTNVYIKTSGVPNYYRDSVTHNDAKDLNATWVLPRVPAVATNHAGVQGGQVGLLTDASVVFHPGDAQSYNNAGVWNRLAYYFEGMDMDASNGHSTPTNMYHHHFDDLKVHDFNAANHSPIVGFAWDGYPIYGPFGYANADGSGGVIRNTSSYVASTATTRANGPAVSTQYPSGCFIEDWSYTAGSGTLDQYNGRFVVTPEYPNGTYAYFTAVDASLKPTYPYFIGPTFYGNFSTVNVGPNGGNSTVATGATQYIPTSISGNVDVTNIENNFKIYPVPVVDFLTIKSKQVANYSAIIFDVNGKVIINSTFTHSDKINLNSFANGVYFVQVTNNNDGEGFMKRIVKQ